MGCDCNTCKKINEYKVPIADGDEAIAVLAAAYKDTPDAKFVERARLGMKAAQAAYDYWFGAAECEGMDACMANHNLDELRAAVRDLVESLPMCDDYAEPLRRVLALLGEP